MVKQMLSRLKKSKTFWGALGAAIAVGITVAYPPAGALVSQIGEPLYDVLVHAVTGG